MQVRIGRKRSNSGLVVHLSIGGDPCACGQKVNTEASAAAANARLCKRGFAPHRVTAAQQANNYASTRHSDTVDTILAAIVEARKTPEERAAATAKADQTAWARDMRAAQAEAAPRRIRTFADIYADHHPEAPRPLRHADQLALFAA